MVLSPPVKSEARNEEWCHCDVVPSTTVCAQNICKLMQATNDGLLVAQSLQCSVCKLCKTSLWHVHHIVCVFRLLLKQAQYLYGGRGEGHSKSCNNVLTTGSEHFIVGEPPAQPTNAKTWNFKVVIKSGAGTDFLGCSASIVLAHDVEISRAALALYLLMPLKCQVIWPTLSQTLGVVYNACVLQIK